MPISDSVATERTQLLGRGTAGELISELVRQGLQALNEAEAAAALGANLHQRTDQRRGHRNGNRERLLATPSGDIQLAHPPLPGGQLFPNPAGAPSPGGSRPVGRGDGGLCLWPFHPQGERAGGGAGLRERHLQIGSEPHLPGPRLPGAGLSGPAP